MIFSNQSYKHEYYFDKEYTIPNYQYNYFVYFHLCDLEGNFIREYKSINEASKETNLDIRHISRNINGIGKQIGGYKFVKKEPVSTRSPIAS